MTEKNTMRRVAGVVYAVAFVVELFIWQPVFSYYAFTYVPVLLALLLIGGIGAMAIWMLSSDRPVKRAASRAVITGTALLVLKTLVMYDLENSLITESLVGWSEKLTFFASVSGSNMWNYVFIVVRLMLLIVAAFFVSNALEPSTPAALAEEVTVAETAPEMEEEEVVVITQLEEGKTEE